MKKSNQDRLVRILFWAGLFGAWMLLAWKMDNSILCPSPVQVAEQMILQLQRPDFFAIISITAGRALGGLALSFAAGVLLACLALFVPLLKGMLNSLVSLMQAVPNVCYIILLLFWTSRNTTVLTVIFCLLFPVVYRSFLEALEQLADHWRDVFQVYPQPWWIILSRACFPAMEPVFASALISGSSMAFKAAVMAEVLAAVTQGVGRSLQAARVNVEVAQVLGWMVWLLLLVFMFEKLWRWLIAALFRKADGYGGNRKHSRTGI